MFKQNSNPMYKHNCRTWQSIFLDSKEVVSLSSKNVADASVVTTINEMVAAVPSICKRWDCSNSIGESLSSNSLKFIKLSSIFYRIFFR